MEENFVVKIRDLDKVYKLYEKPVDRLKEALNPFRKKYHQDFYALKKINLDIVRGQTIGIIGKNGSGKSTLLKILVGVLSPTAGTCQVDGRVASLLELGAGFNPELNGIENIYFNAAVLGYSKTEVDKKLEEILAFADIGEFINQPVKTYSSGMYVRLAFAVAINVDPDILIIDEALAVGDIRFQQKCYRKLKEFKDAGKTVIFVSHDTGAVINYCDRAIWLMDGEICEDGNPEKVCKKYVTYMNYDLETLATDDRLSAGIVERGVEEVGLLEDVSACSSFGEGGARVISVGMFFVENGEKICRFSGGEMVKFCMELQVSQLLMNPIVGVLMNDCYGNHILGINSHVLEMNLGIFEAGKKILVEFEFLFPVLKAGRYSFDVAIADGTQQNHVQHHWVHDAYVVDLINVCNSDVEWYFIIKEADIKIKTML